MRRGFVGLVAAIAALIVAAPPALASFHLVSIREVAPNPAGADSAFIELQMYSPGQNLVGGHPIRFYTETGTLLTSFTLPGNVAAGQTQRTILIGDSAAAGSPDFNYPQLSDAVQTYGPGGAACFDTVDCVAWGNFNNTSGTPLPSPPGPPAAAIPAGSSLERSIARGCATLLEAGDDTNSSAADFALAAPSPRPNSVAPSEQPCSGGGGGGGGGGGTGGEGAPETTITKAPPATTPKTKARFGFESSESNSKFECKLDRGEFKRCISPRRYKNLSPGRHRFRVRAIDADGNVDPTPARAKWRVSP